MPTPFLPTALRAVLFDLDGTLLDSFSGHLAAYQVTFTHFGLPASLDDLLRVYSPDWLQVYRAMGLPEQHWRRRMPSGWQKPPGTPPQLFPGTLELLEALRPRFALGLVTSGSSERVRRDLERNGLDRRFQVIITGGDVCQPKPDPEGLLSALRLLGIAPMPGSLCGRCRSRCADGASGRGERSSGCSPSFPATCQPASTRGCAHCPS